MLYSLKRRYLLITSGLLSLYITLMAMPVMAFAQNDTFEEVNPTKPPKGEWLSKVIGWTLWVAMGIVTLYFIIAAVKAVQAVRGGHGSSSDAMKQGAVALVVLVIFSSLTAFINTIIRSF